MKSLFVSVSQNAKTGSIPATITERGHGARGLVDKATTARDVRPGQSWAFRDHRTMAEVIAEEKTATV